MAENLHQINQANQANNINKPEQVDNKAVARELKIIENINQQANQPKQVSQPKHQVNNDFINQALKNIEHLNKPKQANPAETPQNNDLAQAMRKVEQLKQLQQQQMNSKPYESLVSDAKRVEELRGEKGYQSKMQKDPGIKILANLAKELASLGIDVTPKALKKSSTSFINDELESIFQTSGLKEDNVEVNKNVTREAVKGPQGREEKKDEPEQKSKDSGQKVDIRKLVNTSDVKETIQQYSAAFAQFNLMASPEAREKLEDTKEKLKKKGFSEKEILSLGRAVKRSFRNQFTSDIQNSFIEHMFSQKNTFQFIVTSKKLNRSFEEAIDAEKLTGISNDPQSINEEMKRVAEVSHEEIQDYIRDAVESKLMERHITEKDNRDEVKKLVELGYKVGFNFDNFLKTWEKKKFDLGLFIMEIDNTNRAENAGEISVGEVSAGGVEDKNGYEMTKDEERELLINQLRAEYMKRAITGDPFAVFSFSPKIRKLKNGLIKLGLETEAFNKIEKEAKVLARYRTLEMLRESFLERSTYYELSGPAYGLLNNKLKGLVSNLKNLDMDITKEELDTLRDDANRQMHDHTIIELKSAVSILESHDHPTIEQKVPFMIKLIQRLKEESGFSHGVGEDIDEVIFRHENDQKQVKEHA
jgi:hypothetical protein